MFPLYRSSGALQLLRAEGYNHVTPLTVGLTSILFSRHHFHSETRQGGVQRQNGRRHPEPAILHRKQGVLRFQLVYWTVGPDFSGPKAISVTQKTIFLTPIFIIRVRKIISLTPLNIFGVRKIVFQPREKVFGGRKSIFLTPKMISLTRKRFFLIREMIFLTPPKLFRVNEIKIPAPEQLSVS